ncbi:MAG: Eco57I restriction-modification methylase domain-containing protein [Actinomycetaceae bacterium]|nr:Eco57I restriction-modification methylase domain-containing protein [Actinomycetaceae bacterium]
MTNTYRMPHAAELFTSHDARRFSGDFWTPPVWAQRAHAMLDDELGNNWRDNYAVWDPACGTKNLTAGHTYRELYLSTILAEELRLSSHINREHPAFCFDFLNDSLHPDHPFPGHEPFGNYPQPTNAPAIQPYPLSNTTHHTAKPTHAPVPPYPGVPQQLLTSLSTQEPFLFLMNPPYGTATNNNPTSKTGIAHTRINRIMADKRLNKAAHQLYAQFLYRVLMIVRDYRLHNTVIALFSSDRFLCGGSTWEAFMHDFLQDFSFMQGCYFNAAQFSDVSNRWGIALTIWKQQAGTSPSEIILPLERTRHDNPAIIERFGQRVIRRGTQREFLSTWIRDPIKHRRDYLPATTYPRMSNAFKVNTSRSSRCRLLKGSLGYAHTNANDIEHSGKEVGLYSTAFGSAHGVCVLPENFDRVVVNFAVRKACYPTRDLWICGHDNFYRPTQSVQQGNAWHEFVNDCLIMSLCSASGSHQSALRDLIYMGCRYDVPNEWFYFSRAKLRSLAEQYEFWELLDDVNRADGANGARVAGKPGSADPSGAVKTVWNDESEDAAKNSAHNEESLPERYVYQRLCHTTLSHCSQDVYHELLSLYSIVMPYRRDFYRQSQLLYTSRSARYMMHTKGNTLCTTSAASMHTRHFTTPHTQAKAPTVSRISAATLASATHAQQAQGTAPCQEPLTFGDVPIHLHPSTSLHAWDAGFRQILLCTRAAGISTKDFDNAFSRLKESIAIRARQWKML